jgi:uncharacterized protein YlxW (UPF0749 family)
MMEQVPVAADTLALIITMFDHLLDKSPIIAGVVFCVITISLCTLIIALIAYKSFGKLKHHTENSDVIKDNVISLNAQFKTLQATIDSIEKISRQNTEDIRSVNEDLQNVKKDVQQVKVDVNQLKIRSIN